MVNDEKATSLLVIYICKYCEHVSNLCWQFARGNVIFIRGLEISLQKRVAYILITSHVNMNNLDVMHVVSDMYIWLNVYKNSSWSFFCFLFYLAFQHNVYSLLTSKGAIKWVHDACNEKENGEGFYFISDELSVWMYREYIHVCVYT